MTENNIVSTKDLYEKAEMFARESLSPSTRRCYERDWRIFHDFCQNHDLESYPASPDTVILYMTYAVEKGLKISTLNRRLTSISTMHKAGNHESPVKSPKVDRVLKGIKTKIGEPKKRSKAITWKNLLKMRSYTDRSFIGCRDAAILSIGWTCALRRSEISALNIGDIEFCDEGMIVTVKRSKTDQEGTGAKIGVPRHTDKQECPIVSVERWIKRRSSTELSSETPLFVVIGSKGRGKWWWDSSKRIDPRAVTDIVKQYAKYARLDWQNMSAHSLRRGLATEAGSRDVPERIIARHTRHRSIPVLRGYIEEGNIWNENPLASIYAPCDISSDISSSK